MNFTQAITTCLGKYGTFSGRASRSEYWWFYLFATMITWGSIVVSGAMFSPNDFMFDILPNLVSLVFIVPGLAAGCRRLHDIGKSGWWQLILIIPIIGWILYIVWMATNTKPEGDKYNLIETS